MSRWLVAAIAAGTFLSAPLAARAADAVTFQLSWLAGGEKAPAYLAAHRGMFAAENLDVKILTGRGSTDVLTKLGTGVADLGEAGLDTLMAAKAESGIQVTAVMAFFTKQPDAIFTMTTSGINTLKDVVGRTVATSPFTSSNLTWPVVLKANGVDPDRVRLLKADAATLNGMLASGQVDAIISWTTSAPPAIAAVTNAGKQMKILPWSEYGFDGYATTIMAANKMLTERPDVARRFLKVLKQAIILSKEQPQLAAEAVKAAAPQADLAVLRAQVDVMVPLAHNEISARDGIGNFSVERVKQTWEFVSKANNYPANKIDPLTVISGKYVGS